MSNSNQLNMHTLERLRFEAARPHKHQEGAAGKPTRWHRHPETRRQEILDAALTVFTEKGFSAARINDIARRASISGGTIYLYFASKEEIFKSLVEESLGPQVLQLTQVTREFEGPSDELLRLVVRTIGGFLRRSDRAVLFKLIIAETGNFPELARFYRHHVTDRMLAVFEEIISRGVTRGEFRRIDLTDVAQMVFSAIMYTAIWRTSLGTLDSASYDYGRFIETKLDLILRGLATGKTHVPGIEDSLRGQ
jgi:AcrR family transcriptional regulator